MPKFRKKPVEIEAVQFNKDMYEDFESLPDWFRNASRSGKIVYHGGIGEGNECLTIDTLEGIMTADVNDWIILGIKGEIYPCKPDIFAGSYDKVG